jgi:hypothetical protein
VLARRRDNRGDSSTHHECAHLLRVNGVRTAQRIHLIQDPCGIVDSIEGWGVAAVVTMLRGTGTPERSVLSLDVNGASRRESDHELHEALIMRTRLTSTLRTKISPLRSLS